MIERKHARAAAAFVGVLALSYALGAFIIWNANPGEWPQSARFIIGAFAFTAAALAVLAIAGEV